MSRIGSFALKFLLIYAVSIPAMILPASAAEKVVLQLIWDHQFQFAGYYAAQWNGFYADAGLDVEIRSGVRPDRSIVDAMDELKAGRVDFAIAAANILVERDRGTPLSVLATIFQRSPVAFYYRKEIGHVTPADLVNLRVARRIGGITDVEFQSMLRNEGIDPSLVKPFRQEPGLAHLADGRVDMIPGYTLATPLVAKKLGLRIMSLKPLDYGVDFYGDSLVAHRRIIDRDYGLVQRFISASLKGWEYALAHTEEIARRIANELPRAMPVDDLYTFNLFQAEEVKKLMLYPLIRTGNMNVQRWRRMHEQLTQSGLVKGSFDADNLIFDPAGKRWEAEERFVFVIESVLAIVVIILVAASAWTFALRRTVAKRTEELRESEEKFRTVVNFSPTKIHIKDLEGRYLLVNKEAEKLFGVSDEDARGKTSAEIFPKERAEDFGAHDRAVIEAGRTIKMEEEWVRDDGVHTYLTVKFPIRDAAGKAVAVGAIGTDITDRKQAELAKQESENRLQSIIDGSPAAISLTDCNGRLLLANRTYANWMNSKPSELVGKTVRDLFPREQANQIEVLDQRVIDTREITASEGPWTFKDERPRILVTYKCPIISADGEVTAVSTIDLDISERKQLEEQLLQAQRMEAVGQLTGGVAHDFNNLLAIMIVNAQLLEDRTGEDEEAKELVEAIMAAVDRGASLTGRLLAFSRKTTLASVAADVSDLIGSLHDLLQRTLGETVELKVEDPPDLWPATIDPHQFENALVNLAINAKDAMPTGGILTIETANVTLDKTYAEQHEEVTPGDYVKVAVSDTGTGMSPGVLQKVFEPFFTTKEVGKGSGMGLSMVYGFVKQSKGHITIYSELDHGTTVKLYMPRSQEGAAKTDATDAEDDTLDIARGSERILVVEDDPDVRKVPVAILRDQGYEVAEAGNGEDAIDHLKTGQTFDLLFTDVVLPGGMNGVEIAEEAKRIQPNIKVLYTTGYAQNAVIQNGQLDPGATLVNKPFRRAELLEKVRAMLDSEDS